jgi:hypothetical protein
MRIILSVDFVQNPYRESKEIHETIRAPRVGDERETSWREFVHITNALLENTIIFAGGYAK